MSGPQVGDIVRYTPGASDPDDGPRSDIWTHREQSGQMYVVVGVSKDDWYAKHFGSDAVCVYEPHSGTFDGTTGTFVAPSAHFTVVSAADHPADVVAATAPKAVR